MHELLYLPPPSLSLSLSFSLSLAHTLTHTHAHTHADGDSSHDSSARIRCAYRRTCAAPARQAVGSRLRHRYKSPVHTLQRSRESFTEALNSQKRPVGGGWGICMGSRLRHWYGVAMVSRIDKFIGLFCRILSLL